MGSEDTDFDFSSSDLSHCRVHMSVSVGEASSRSLPIPGEHDDQDSRLENGGTHAYLSLAFSLAAVSSDFELKAY